MVWLSNMTSENSNKQKCAGTPIALTVAGSDCSGGAGLQADLKTFVARQVYGASIVTALTAQNTQGVSDVMSVSAEFIARQFDAIASDLDVAAVKTGMLSDAETISVVATHLSRSTFGPVVVDPVMVATSGDRLLENGALGALVSMLLPLADVVTPNLNEAAVLSGQPEARTREDMIAQAKAIACLGPKAVLVKGGHFQPSAAVNQETALDVLWSAGEAIGFSAPRIETRNTHGTGCTLSAAITAEFACGKSLRKAVRSAKAYVWSALEGGRDKAIGAGCGPLDHCVDARQDVEDLIEVEVL